ncbi:RusA family crossover junction endodeoxyribonuclease, partial [Escherichia coli]|uniref:RusA family crossover junction endodeoxyribonuclease n=1 Tax=Escherichia coli TaxID=562 RepID=UPI003D362B0D
SIKNDGHYFCRAGGNRPDGLNEPVTDNILKAPLDALTHAGVLMDDEQFDEINIVRGQPVSGGRLGVKIYKIESE